MLPTFLPCPIAPLPRYPHTPLSPLSYANSDHGCVGITKSRASAGPSGEDLILKDLPEFDFTQSESGFQIVAARPISVFGLRRSS